MYIHIETFRFLLMRYCAFVAVVDNDFALAQELGKSEHEDQEQKQFEALQVCILIVNTMCKCPFKLDFFYKIHVTPGFLILFLIKLVS